MRFQKESNKNPHKKCLISIIWSVNWIHSLLDVPKGTPYNSTFFCDVIVPHLLENVRAYSRRRTLKGVLVHLDKGRPHNPKKSNKYLTEFRARRVPHPAYGLYLASNDFFFGTMETELQNIRSTADRIWSWQYRRFSTKYAKMHSILLTFHGQRGSNGWLRIRESTSVSD
jgi:hypothetical protein